MSYENKRGGGWGWGYIRGRDGCGFGEAKGRGVAGASGEVGCDRRRWGGGG